MKSVLTIFLFISFETLHAQTDTAKIPRADSVVYQNPQKFAEFPGGKPGWQKFMARNLNWPGPDALPEPGNVIVSFTVMPDGSLTNIKVTGEPSELVKAATRLIKHSPKWIPAENEGKRVANYIIQPINIEVSNQ